MQRLKIALMVVTREQLSMAVALLQERTRENDDECAKFLATFENNKQETK